ncbi:MAG: TonB-dependent receptor plug domain-containing protein, partial [Burkholderiales bacterium]
MTLQLDLWEGAPMMTRRWITGRSGETACVSQGAEPVFLLTKLRTLIGIWIALHAVSGYAAEVQVDNLADLSLEQLSDIEVTSVSGRAERLSEAPASIFVITGEDIRRSGANTLPEALRLAPNLQVARTAAASYAISSRGFNNA